MQSKSLNYYDVLDVMQNASQEEIFEAYSNTLETFSLSNTELYKVFSSEEAQAWIEFVKEAYSVLGFPNSRRAYDLELKLQLQPRLPHFEFVEPTPEDGPETIEEEPLPNGYAATKISQYSIDVKIEEQIKKQEVFDGIFLKKVREYKKIDLTHFSEYTCIAIRHLYAIENNNFSVLPAAVFVRGYIIQYCKTLGLDEKTVVPSFMNLLKNA